jgi:hypothetical protein
VKKLAICLMSLSMIFCLTSCQYTERRKASMQLNVLSSRFENMVEKGQTTRVQEQAYIKAVSDLSLQLDRSVRGTNAANQTRQNTMIFSNTGVDPNAPLMIKKK